MHGLRIPGMVPTRPKPAYLAYDNRDDRREIFRGLLQRLHPQARVAWLKWCCQHAVFPHSQLRPTVGLKTWRLLRETLAGEDEVRLTFDVYMSFVDLTIQYDLDPAKALAKLVEMARRQMQ